MKNKTQQTTGWLDNFNDSKVTLPKGFVGEGTFDGPNFSNGAWGGPAQNGKKLTYLEPNDKRLPSAKNSDGTHSSEVAVSIGGEGGEPAYLIPSFKHGKPLKDPIKEFRKTGEHLGGPFKTWQEADKWEKEVRHPYVEKGQAIPTPFRRKGLQYENGGNMPGSVGFSYARTGAPSNGKYAKKTMASAKNGITKDDNGYWDPKNWGEPVEIGSNNITMQGVHQPLLGVSDKGDMKLMQPGKNYKFKGKKVTEYPVGKNGTKLKELDQMTNFTNYNEPQPGGWLDQY
jgi:hypothetical protein